MKRGVFNWINIDGLVSKHWLMLKYYRFVQISRIIIPLFNCCSTIFDFYHRMFAVDEINQIKLVHFCSNCFLKSENAPGCNSKLMTHKTHFQGWVFLITYKVYIYIYMYIFVCVKRFAYSDIKNLAMCLEILNWISKITYQLPRDFN